MALKEKLQEIRRINELSQDQFAEMLNVSRQSVSKWERGHGYPEIDKLIFISERFNVSLDELLKDSPAQRKTISLRKDDVYPRNEIYPGNTQPAPSVKLKTQDSFRAPVNYQNYSNCTPQPAQAPCKRKRKRLVRKRVVAAAALGTVVICFICFVVSVNRTGPVYEETAYNVAERCYENDDIKCLYNKNSQTYYIVEQGQGFVNSIYNEDFDNYIQLSDMSTDETFYVESNYESFYSCENVIYTDDENNSLKFIIPYYMMPDYISADQISDYIVMKNYDGETKFVLKKMVFPAFEYSGVNTDSRNSPSGGDNSVVSPSGMNPDDNDLNGELESVNRPVN
ncbi:MAG: helix-turn-helix transcriptional regulator [Oscillospiraceae bacterium]|nr:helix-turn-helix transcriptional regulator [Oscillospiraceae bacterium]